MEAGAAAESQVEAQARVPLASLGAACDQGEREELVVLQQVLPRAVCRVLRLDQMPAVLNLQRQGESRPQVEQEAVAS